MGGYAEVLRILGGGGGLGGLGGRLKVLGGGWREIEGRRGWEGRGEDGMEWGGRLEGMGWDDGMGWDGMG